MFCSARQKSCPIVSVRPSETHVSHLHARIHLSASITAAPNIYSSHSPPCLSSGWIGADRLTTEIPKTLSLYPCPCFVAFSKLSSAIDSVSSTTFSTPVSMGVAVDKPAGRIVFLVVRSNSASDIPKGAKVFSVHWASEEQWCFSLSMDSMSPSPHSVGIETY